MPLPRWLARANRRGINRVTRRFAAWVPPFALVLHRGRRSGSEYQTPVMIFAAGAQLVIALTYGSEAHWVQNVRAAAGCGLITRGHRIETTNPRLVGPLEGLASIPAVLRPLVRLIGVREFLVLDRVISPPPTGISPRQMGGG